MSFVCRFNPNHKMKTLMRREIHEQKCPDKLKNKEEFKLCPYNPYHYIRKESYDNHIKQCENKPKITQKEEEELEKAKDLNDIMTEQEQIKYARMKYYKDCVQEPKIIGINENVIKKNKIKKDKIIKKKFRGITEKEGQHLVSIADAVCEYENNENEMIDFGGDGDFESDKENKDKIDIKPDEFLYRYDPNDEDKDISKNSANIIDPNEIKAILKGSD